MPTPSYHVGLPPPTGDNSLDFWLRRVLSALMAIPSATSLSTLTSNYTVVQPFETLLGDCSTATVTITVPSGFTWIGARYDVKKIDSSAHALVVSGCTIDGATSLSIKTQNTSYTLTYDGTVYRIL